MGEVRGVSWPEAARMMALCWAICAVAYAVLDFVDQPTPPIAAPVVTVLARWFWIRHRHWLAAAVAACAASPVAFALTDLARLHWDRTTGDALATAAGTTVALAVFTGASRFSNGHPSSHSG